jgi:ABC-2 type transport system ATP-binding protein
MELKIKNVSKRYTEDTWGLRSFSLTIGPGVLGLLGTNGAGKSTLLRMLATITRPTSGEITWNGINICKEPDAVRAVLGYLPQDFGVYPHLNAVEFLEYMAVVKGLDWHTAKKQIKRLLDMVNLSGMAKRPLGEYSGGQRQRVGIAQALLNNPRLLIVDEPTTGLDPGERLGFRNLLTDLSGDRVVILSTHIVPDVESAATSIALIDRGCLLDHLIVEDMLTQVEGQIWEWIVPGSQLENIKERFIVTEMSRRSNGIQLRLISGKKPGEGAVAASPRLEDAFIALTKENRAREGQ